MKSPVPRAWLWSGAALLAALLVLAVIGVSALIEDGRKAIERHYREYVHEQIADVRAGKRDVIFLTSGFALDEFAKAASGLAEADRFQLNVEYTQETDGFLRRIAGLRAVRWLTLLRNDVTPAGMESVVTLPNLETLVFHQVSVTDEWLKRLASAPKLKRLILSSWDHDEGLTIATILALPHLRDLAFQDECPVEWLKQLEEARSLTRLTFSEEQRTPQAIQVLREKLPDCVVEQNKRH